MSFVETETEKFRAFQNVLAPYGVTVPENELPAFKGRKRKDYLLNTFPQLQQQVDEIIEQVHEKDKTLAFTLMPGMHELLSFLRKKECVCAIATGTDKETVTHVLSQENIAQAFAILVTGDDVQASKPDPTVFQTIISKHPDNDTFIIEDSQAGIKAATKVQATIISFGTQHSSAHKSVRNHKELLDYFQRILYTQVITPQSMRRAKRQR